MDTKTATGMPVVVTREEMEARPLVPLDESIEGVMHRVLWQTESSMAGVMEVDGGHRLGRHSHRINHHHMWVLDGEARIMDEMVGAGSYVHVPAGVEHDLDARETAGCRVFYLYLRPPD